MKRLSRVSALVLAAAVGLCGVSRGAAPLDDKVPGDALLYVGWAGAEALQAQYNGSNLKGIVEASAAREYITKQLPALIAQAGREDPTAAQVIAKVQTGLAAAWQHPTAFYVGPFAVADPRRPEFSVGLICDAGADAQKINELLSDAIKNIPASPDMPPVAVKREGTVVSITLGMALSVPAGASLSANPTFAKVMAGFKQPKPAIALYADVSRGLSLLNDAMAKVPDVPRDAREKMPLVIDTLGLAGMTQVAAVSYFDGKAWTDQSIIGYTGARKGLFALIDSPPLDMALLQVVPKDAAAFSIAKLDMQKIFTEVRSAIGKIDPPTLKEFDSVLAEANQQIGLDVEQDIIAPLGTDWIVYRAPQPDLGGNSIVMVHKLRDPQRFAATLAKAEQTVNRLGQGRFKIDRMTSGKIEYSAINFLQVSVAWTVQGDFLFVSSADGVKAGVKQVANKSPSIAESDLYKAAMAQMPAGIKPVSITYANPIKLYPELRRTVLGVLPVARAAGVDIPADILPDPDDLAPFMTPGAEVSWWDADGLHTVSHSAFPGAALIAGNPNGPALVAGVALGTAVALPSLGRARELSNRSVDAANLRGIDMSCMIYAADNQDKLPDDLSQLVAGGQIAPRQLVSRRSGTQPLDMTPEMEKLAKADPTKFAAEVARHTDFVYLGKGVRNSMDASLVLAYEKPGPNARDGINIAFADGHVEFVRYGPGMEDVFKSTNEARAKAGLPAIPVPAP